MSRLVTYLLAASLPAGAAAQETRTCQWPDRQMALSHEVRTDFYSLILPQSDWTEEDRSEDSVVRVWSDGRVRVSADYGDLGVVFSDRARGPRPGEREWTRCDGIVDERPVRVVAYEDDEGFEVEGFWRGLPPLFDAPEGVFWMKIMTPDPSWRETALAVLASVRLDPLGRRRTASPTYALSAPDSRSHPAAAETVTDRSG